MTNWSYHNLALSHRHNIIMLMVQCKPVVSPLIMHWRYDSLAPSHSHNFARFIATYLRKNTHHVSFSPTECQVQVSALRGPRRWHRGHSPGDTRVRAGGLQPDHGVVSYTRHRRAGPQQCLLTVHGERLPILLPGGDCSGVWLSGDIHTEF